MALEGSVEVPHLLQSFEHCFLVAYALRSFPWQVRPLRSGHAGRSAGPGRGLPPSVRPSGWRAGAGRPHVRPEPPARRAAPPGLAAHSPGACGLRGDLHVPGAGGGERHGRAAQVQVLQLRPRGRCSDRDLELPPAGWGLRAVRVLLPHGPLPAHERAVQGPGGLGREHGSVRRLHPAPEAAVRRQRHVHLPGEEPARRGRAGRGDPAQRGAHRALLRDLLPGAGHRLRLCPHDHHSDRRGPVPALPEAAVGREGAQSGGDHTKRRRKTQPREEGRRLPGRHRLAFLGLSGGGGARSCHGWTRLPTPVPVTCVRQLCTDPAQHPEQAPHRGLPLWDPPEHPPRTPLWGQCCSGESPSFQAASAPGSTGSTGEQALQQPCGCRGFCSSRTRSESPAPASGGSPPSPPPPSARGAAALLWDRRSPRWFSCSL